MDLHETTRLWVRVHFSCLISPSDLTSKELVYSTIVKLLLVKPPKSGSLVKW
jgi:hypothetical protein